MFFGSKLFATLWASWTSWKSNSFARLGKFSFIICSNKLSISCYSPSGTLMLQMLECLKLSLRFFSLSSFCDWVQSILWASWLPVFWTLHQTGCLSPHHLALFLKFALFFHLGRTAFSRHTSVVVLVNFFFTFLVVSVPCSFIFWHFWLFIDFRLVLSSFWLFEEA